jgi:hypothetical protein
MKREWIDEKLNLLSIKLDGFKTDSSRFFFEPTEEIYRNLESGDENELHFVVAKIAEHLEIPIVPIVRYDWGLKMDPEVAGQIQNMYQLNAIRIPFFYVGKKYAIGNILAHEMTHAFLFSKGIFFNDLNENEKFTDLTAVFIGLGKLMLNGLTVMPNQYLAEVQILGYLPLDSIVYAFKNICERRSVSLELATKNLVPEAISKISAFNK